MTNAAKNQQTNASLEKYSMAAKPAPISIHPLSTALIVVDMQNDFAAKGGMLERQGVDISMIQKVIPTIAKVIDVSRQAGLKIIYLKMGFQEDLSDLGREGSPNRVRHLHFDVGQTITAPNGSKSRILIRDTWNTDIVPQLKPQQGDIVLYKTRYSGFYNTDLDSVLQQLNIQNLIVTGCTTTICVESTIRDAMFRDYSAVVLEDCTAEPVGYDLQRSNHEASLLAIQFSFGWVSTSEAFLSAIQVEAGGIKK
jgi:ureidoacrylate peracid hydrolase